MLALYGTCPPLNPHYQGPENVLANMLAIMLADFPISRKEGR